MIQHTIKLFFRNINRYKSTFIINVLGLSTGLACVILIALWVNDEVSIDKFHANDSELFQVWNKWDRPEGIKLSHWTPDMLAETMAEKLPEVKYASPSTLPSWTGKIPLTADDKIVKSEGIFAGKDYLNIFSYPLLQGEKDHVLSSSSSMVISESLANKLFGSTENAMGKSVEWSAFNATLSNQITGVFKDVGANSTIQFDFILPFQNFITSTQAMGRESSWTNNAPLTYVLLEKGTDVETFAEKIVGFSKAQNQYVEADLFLKQYSNDYLYGEFENGQVAGGRVDYIYLFLAIALFTLIIACINFVNLSTANATRRLKEIGIKKALGSSRKAIIWQYFGESTLTVLFSLCVALMWVVVSLPAFNSITGKELELIFSPISLTVAMFIVLITGFLAGSYPAFHLSNFKPVAILKGKIRNSNGEVWLRKSLVVFQFSLSIVLIISVVVVYNQIEFIQAQNIGIDKEQVIYFPKEGKLQENSKSFLAEVKSSSSVKNASSALQTLIGSETNMTTNVSWDGKEEANDIDFHSLGARYDLIETLNIEMVEGRSFSKEHSLDKEAIILNETAIKAMGLKDPVGKTMELWGEKKLIIGIARDFHFQSFRNDISPILIYMAEENQASLLMVRLESGQEDAALAHVKSIFSQFNPGYELDYSFLDEDFQKIYQSEQRIASLSKYFAGLAIIISCLGLFGLASFSAERRRKEISIRKVLGQSSLQVTSMFSLEFIKLIIIALIISFPVAYFITQNWLNEFAYKITLNLSYFLTAALITLALAILTIASQTVKAAFQNPAEGLKEN